MIAEKKTLHRVTKLLRVVGVVLTDILNNALSQIHVHVRGALSTHASHCAGGPKKSNGGILRGTLGPPHTLHIVPTTYTRGEIDGIRKRNTITYIYEVKVSAFAGAEDSYSGTQPRAYYRVMSYRVLFNDTAPPHASHNNAINRPQDLSHSEQKGRDDRFGKKEKNIEINHSQVMRYIPLCWQRIYNTARI